MAERGTIIEGKYEVLKLIGKGGMSKVYLAMDKNLNKQWAIPTETMQSNLNAFKQKYASSDEKLTSATSYLNSEVGDCNNKINELNIEIANLQRQYEAEKAAEEAARRAAEEAARKAAQEAAQKLTNLLRK